jgi:hypothetical protein
VSTIEHVRLKIPRVFDVCPAPSGQLSGATLGPIALGETRAQARRLLPRFTARDWHTDNFCLAAGAGIRVGYSSHQLLGTSAAATDATASGRIVLALTANRHYTLRGVRPSTRLAAAARMLPLGRAVRLGRNTWYVLPGQISNGVLKVRDGVIREVGIAASNLTTTRTSQAQLLRNF